MGEMFKTCLSWLQLMLRTLKLCLGYLLRKGCVLSVCAYDHLPKPSWEKFVQALFLEPLSSGSWGSLLEGFP